MEADDPRNEPSSRTKRQIPEKGIGKEEEKKRRKRGSGAKSRPGMCLQNFIFPSLSPTSTLLGWSGAALNGKCGEQKMVTTASRPRRGNSEGWSRSMASSRAWSSPVQVRHLRSH